jgi:flavodoxin I
MPADSPGARLRFSLHGRKTRYISFEPAGKSMATVTVLVDSRGGHTRKVAEAIADELGVSVGDIKKRPLPDAEILFLGSGTYGHQPGDEMRYLLRDGTFTGRKVALFATAGSRDGEKLVRDIAEMVTKKGAQVLGDPAAPGKAIMVRYRNVHKEDLEAARTWARNIAGK